MELHQVSSKGHGVETKNMAILNIIGKKNTTSYKVIHKQTGIPIYKDWNKKVDAIINYGVAGKALDSFFKIHKSAENILMLNKFIGRSKFLAIEDAKEKNVLVPETKIRLSSSHELENWIEKPLQSNRGRGIILARGRKGITGKYYQRLIPKRYELRIHAFKWIPTDNWVVQKRVGPADQITWNFHKGGRFITVHNPNSFGVFKRALAISKEILDIRKMAFGAVDFIVSQDLRVYFIEINSAPGFSNLSTGIYVDAFNALKNVKDIKDVL